jgi:hypothetical protein
LAELLQFNAAFSSSTDGAPMGLSGLAGEALDSDGNLSVWVNRREIERFCRLQKRNAKLFARFWV